MWKATELAERLEIPLEIIRKKIVFWKNHNVIREHQRDVYQIVEVMELEKSARSQSDGVIDEGSENDIGNGGGEEEEDDGGEDDKETNAAEIEEMWRVCESFVTGMLTNLGKLSLERIHSMLSQFVESYSCSSATILKAQLLDRLVKEDKLEFTTPGNLYSLKK